MKSLGKIFGYFLVLACLSSCLGDKDDPSVGISLEQDQIIGDFLDERGIVYEKTETGVYVYTKTPGNGQPIIGEDVVDAVFSLSIFQGNTIYQAEPYTFSPTVASFLPGMSDGSLVMEVGEDAKLFIPSIRGFGSGSFTVNDVRVPQNSILVMDLKINSMLTVEQNTQREKDSIVAYLNANELIAETLNISDTTFYKVILEEGTPDIPLPEEGSNVTVSYTLTSLDGSQEFDTSTAFTFKIGSGGVIPGFDEGVKMMQKNEKALLLLPSNAAYGARGSQGIKPYTVLKFEITLIDFSNN